MKRILIVDDVKGWRDFHTNVMYEIFDSEIDIVTAECAQEAYNLLLQGLDFDIIITDMQMEDTFAPKHAGEWLVEQIKTFKKYFRTKIVIISAAYNIRHIADTLGVDCIPKSTARSCLSAYKEILLT